MGSLKAKADWTDNEVSYSRPPGPGILQTTVIAVLKTAGVRHTRRIKHVKPVRVIGHSTAAKLQHTHMPHRDTHTALSCVFPSRHSAI